MSIINIILLVFIIGVPLGLMIYTSQFWVNLKFKWSKKNNGR